MLSESTTKRLQRFGAGIGAKLNVRNRQMTLPRQFDVLIAARECFGYS
jgi:hypothetical protein